MPINQVTERQVRTISRKDSGPADFDVECVTETLGQYLAGFATVKAVSTSRSVHVATTASRGKSPFASTSHSGIPLSLWSFASNFVAGPCDSVPTVAG